MAYPVSRARSRVSGKYGPRVPIWTGRGFSSPFHRGDDFAPIPKGAHIAVYAVGKGVVTRANTTAFTNAGKNIMIRLDGDGSIWWYAHLERVDVRVGDRVVDGQPIGLMGTTGRSTGVHLHLERHYPTIDKATNPWPYIANEWDPAVGKDSGRPSKPAPSKPSKPARPSKPSRSAKPSKSGGVVIGSRIKLATPWTVYRTASQAAAKGYAGGRIGRMGPGVYTVIGISRGQYKLRGGDGRTGWIHSSAKAGLQ